VRHVLWHVLRSAFRHVLRRVLHVLIFHVSPKGSEGGGKRVLGVNSKAALATSRLLSGVGGRRAPQQIAFCT